MKRLDGRLLLVGAGKMGLALLEGWLKQGLRPSQTIIQEPAPSPQAHALIEAHQIKALTDAKSSGPFQVVVLAIKPQILPEVVSPLHPLTGPQTLVISIAAGITTGRLAQLLAPDTPIVRIMPNTPAAIGAGMSVLFAAEGVSMANRQLAAELLSAVGETAWIDDEAQMDAVTAVSGSGPAYVFLLAEYLAQAGETAGLAPELAQRLANATIAGAGELLKRSSLTPAQLRENVTSPGGTTAAALAVLMAEPGLRDIVEKAVLAAAKRSKELAENGTS